MEEENSLYQSGLLRTLQIWISISCFFAWAAVLAETFGGAMLVMVLLTRFAGSMVMITMLVTIFFQKWGGEVWEMLPVMGFLWISICAVVMGSGRIGIDHLIIKNGLLKTDLLKLSLLCTSNVETLNLLITYGNLFVLLFYTALVRFYSGVDLCYFIMESSQTK